jgi:hypothetical protein
MFPALTGAIERFLDTHPASSYHWQLNSILLAAAVVLRAGDLAMVLMAVRDPRENLDVKAKRQKLDALEVCRRSGHCLSAISVFGFGHGKKAHADDAEEHASENGDYGNADDEHDLKNLR